MKNWNFQRAWSALYMLFISGYTSYLIHSYRYTNDPGQLYLYLSCAIILCTYIYTVQLSCAGPACTLCKVKGAHSIRLYFPFLLFNSFIYFPLFFMHQLITISLYARLLSCCKTLISPVCRSYLILIACNGPWKSEAM